MQLRRTPSSASVKSPESGDKTTLASTEGISPMYSFSVVTIRVKWMPKPAPVKPRPPIACRFYFAEFAVPPRLYLRHNPPSSPTLLMHLDLAAYRRPLPRRFVSPSAAPTAPFGPAFLASPGGPPVSPRPRRTSTIGLHRAVERTWAPMTTP